ncbi:NAD(P)-dependent oxidoreductase [Polyangium sp. 6x1]|uniref:NAD(P)-dependent oxidoreductase n=1 Tax=Polyangium sp. 6x1 TaxID=3042689 RepID=UPI0024823B37|nr:NAD(P)-dependent oxidoreductase [Polyangium sp. 6x1]MDI1449942.1 NAD(P)-dependent oxidoreductase [Polyangium sp. 6x1]
MQIVFCGTGWFPIVDAIRARLPSGVALRSWDPGLPLAGQVEDADVLLPSNARLDAEVIAAPRHLRLIQQPAVGTEGIDLVAARARGVPVCNAPGTNGQSVAEAALFLILALARRFPRAARAFAERSIGAPLGVELAGRTLGVLGLGRSGTALARIAEALGMRILAARSTTSREDVLDLAARADVISIHCPLTPGTRGLVGEAFLSRVKPGALLVNVARGPIVDRGALLHALETGRLGGAGLDVFWEEPWDPADPLYRRDDVVVLPHVAGSTEEAFARIADIVAGNVHRLVRGEPLLHRIA